MHFLIYCFTVYATLSITKSKINSLKKVTGPILIHFNTEVSELRDQRSMNNIVSKVSLLYTQ